MNFGDFFRRATQITAPYPYQRIFAEGESLPELLSIPTGLGKTAAVVLGWLYRRRFHKNPEIRESTPRRLVYCFPMRVLVEQTYDVTQGWLEKLGIADKVKVHLLMGGVDSSDWDEYPESDAILIGTQDMLLSRALNRGYGMSRYRWPMHFGLLNNDSLWVMDETQLMGVGLTTTAQLQGLRKKLKTYGNAHSLWMSATLDASPIRTIDHPEPEVGYVRQGLTDSDLQEKEVQKRIGAKKSLEQSKLILSAESEKKGYAKNLAAAIKAEHESQAGRLTLVVLNRVSRTQDVFTELETLCSKTKSTVDLGLIHARFRPHERRVQEERLLKNRPPAAGRIVIATQAIAAGVAVSAATLFTELAPWPSLVQRFGRCNREGDFTDAKVIWIDTQPKDDKDKVLLPYDQASLNQSREFLKKLSDVGPNSLKATQQQFDLSCEAPVVHTLRRKDLLDLWDTTPDLAGNDLDVSRFIRDADDTDVQFYWRDFEGALPTASISAPQQDELCAVAIGSAKEFLTKLEKTKNQRACIWKPLERRWQKLDSDHIRSGMVLLLKTELGGYNDRIGWTGDPTNKPTPKPPPPDTPPEDALESESSNKLTNWVSITKHLAFVVEAVERLRDLNDNWDHSIPWSSLVTAARWHDVGKSHPAFQNMLLHDQPDAESRKCTLWAKSGGKKNGPAAARGKVEYWVADTVNLNQRIKRTGFRHELASALAWLQHRGSDADADLIAFLIAAHHGRVRGSIRSLPNEEIPIDPKTLFARGLWGGDELPEVDLGNGEIISATRLDLSLIQLGTVQERPSWLVRVLELRDDTKNYGVFRLSFLETVLRVADWQGTTAGEK